MAVDYGVYLVTDSTPAILGTRGLAHVVEAALRGGASVVQYRDKSGAHEAVVQTARELHALTQRFGVPLLVNDRVAVAVAVGCEGVHLGQGDMAPAQARRMLGPGKIIGVTAGSAAEAIAACEAGADYIGIGAVFATPTAGATSVRRDAVKTLLSAGHFAVIKGNASELLTVLGAAASTAAAQRGVDSTAVLATPQRAALVRALARQRRCVALLTGATDLLSHGRRTVRVDNGHALLGAVTGTGCTLGTTVSAMVAAYAPDPLAAAVAGTVMFGVAAEMAAARSDVRGPGTFVPAFIDELYGIRRATAEGDLRWLAMAKVQAVEVEDEA
ncbi:Thiamine-phosphate synthase [Tolypocladium ophioglossoides CBS 100239]|uniref:hydroxyethylthiazole kinase n=1 Tax=Tolypocladium ophioglossoides (strain CBS 100239) TaxID=1163406 RepID=A0A0L0NLK2_TOLOC|nr:Thiamine-phosphate synthase [Tolypocladium ophioglossoides CBS 100239]